MVKKKQLIYHPDTKLFEFDGKFFNFKKTKVKKIGKIIHEDVSIYEEINPDNLENLRGQVCKKLKDNVNSERVIEEALKGLGEKQLKRLIEHLNYKKTKVREHNGCYGLEIDTGEKNSSYIELFS
jgi:hypothetical protein